MQRSPLPQQDPTLLGYPDAAELLNVPIGTLYAWVSERRIPHIRFSSRMVRFDRDQLLSWLEERRVA